MRIAVLSSNFIRLPPEPGFVPPGSSGAPEYIMHLICEELVKRKHQVTLFASGDSKTAARLISVSDKASSMDANIGERHHMEYEHLLISTCYRMAQDGEFDLIHSLFDMRSAYYADLVNIPTVSTLHSPLTGVRKGILSKIPNTQFYVSISNAQRKALPQLNYIDTIYHGIEITKYPFSDSDGGYMIFVGRIAPEKGTDIAVELALKCKQKLYIFGECTIKDKNFWNESILPYVDNVNIFHAGFVDKQRLTKYYQKAKLFIFPVIWEEPFGLVMIEAMVTGTPVVAYASGSVPEIVVDGVTGFIVNPSETDIRGDFNIKKTGTEGLKEAIEKIYSMSDIEYRKMRKACREHVEKNFTIEKMVSGYEEVYQKLLAKQNLIKIS